jgi:hypothetical protein
MLPDRGGESHLEQQGGEGRALLTLWGLWLFLEIRWGPEPTVQGKD